MPYRVGLGHSSCLVPRAKAARASVGLSTRCPLKGCADYRRTFGRIAQGGFKHGVSCPDEAQKVCSCAAVQVGVVNVVHLNLAFGYLARIMATAADLSAARNSRANPGTCSPSSSSREKSAGPTP